MLKILLTIQMIHNCAYYFVIYNMMASFLQRAGEFLNLLKVKLLARFLLCFVNYLFTCKLKMLCKYTLHSLLSFL